MAGADDFLRTKRQFEEIARRLQNLRPVLTVAAEDVRTFVDDRFDTATAPDGTEWADLAPSTLLSRAMKGTRKRKGGKRRRRSIEALHNAIGAVKPLVDTGRLRSSIAVRVDRTGLTVGSNVEYAEYQQLGTREGLKARRFLPFVEKSEGEYVLDTSGPAGELWKDVTKMVREYVATGRIR